MPIKREFLGLDEPPLRNAVEKLATRYRRGAALDLSGVICVMPGGRAGRRLLEVLVERAEADSLVLAPPVIETVGRLPENLYQPQRPFASDFVQQLAWSQALQQSPADTLKEIFDAPPAADDRTRWLELADLLRRQHVELAADGLHFGDVAERGAEPDQPFADADRWRALRAVQQDYLRRLDALQLWDIQTARLVAIEKRECRTDRDIILIGTADMNVATRKMLDQVADRATALVFAPKAWTDRFDEHGCLIPAAWEATTIAIDDQCVHLTEGPNDQAETATRCLAKFGTRYRADEITIGLADENLTPFVQRTLNQNDVPARSAAGLPIADTLPYRLLDEVARLLRSWRRPELASLVRHPDLSEWLDNTAPVGWLETLDEFAAVFLQARLDMSWSYEAKRCEKAAAVWQCVREWIGPLRGAARKLDAWTGPLTDLLLALYGRRRWNRDDANDRAVLRALDAIRDVLVEFAERVPAELQPRLECAEAIELLLRQVRSTTIGLPYTEPAVELLGWLELPLDDAPALIVCSLNEGFVPSSLNSDLFLPNQLRVRLGLQDNSRRYARDAYALEVLLRTRESLDLIVGRRNADGDPLRPSRLLFAADRETIARRAKRFFTLPEPKESLPPLAGSLIASRTDAGFFVPHPRPLTTPLPSLRVTAFRSYLECPYRFYLRHVLRLGGIDDAVEELDGGAFGELLHEVLGEFGRGPHREATDAAEIREFLDRALDQQSRRRFGAQPLPAVRVQVEQMRIRLHAFAERQAAWAASGWRIIAAEETDGDSIAAPFDVDGEAIELRGRIDRIDRHRETGQIAVLDYKSSDAGKTPEQTHRKRGEWLDLQLPLYRHLVRTLKIDGPVTLGYVLLPKDSTKAGFSLATWDETALAEADEAAREVVRKIRRQIFWPPVDDPLAAFGEFASICQDGVFGRRLEELLNDG